MSGSMDVLDVRHIQDLCPWERLKVFLKEGGRGGYRPPDTRPADAELHTS